MSPKDKHPTDHTKSSHKKKCPCSGNAINNSEGELIISVTRDSFNIPFALPYCLWGAIYINTNFGVVLQPYLPPNTTVSSAIVGSTIVFTYNNAAFPGNDTITITIPGSGLISYIEMLTNLNTNYMRTDFVLFNCNSANDGTFLTDQQIKSLQLNLLNLIKIDAGSNAKDIQNIIPATRTEINNSVKEIIEISLRNEPIKPDSVWVQNFGYVPLIGGLQFTYTIFISERINMNEEKATKFAFLEDKAKNTPLV
jgi:hypothetical protein